MNKDTLKLLQTRKNPINSMQDLHKRLIGTREGFIFYTTDFRKDFDTKIAMLGHLEQENQQLKDRDLIIAAELTKLQDENKILKENAENNDKVVDKVNWENQLLKKENKKYKEVIDKIDKYINDYNVFEVFSFPLMKRWEEEQVKSSIDYEFKTSLIKDLKDILKEVE